jgi:hypothetical protein
MYLKHLSRLLRADVRRVSFTTQHGLPGDVLKYKHIKYDKAVLFDHDGNTAAFRKALGTCVNAKCACAYSNRNFDLWLLLHKRIFFNSVSSNNAYVNEIRNAFKLGREADIKNEKVMESILAQISLRDVITAIHNAKKIREQKLSGDAGRIGSLLYYDNPDLQVQDFVVTVFAECNEPLKVSLSRE